MPDRPSNKKRPRDLNLLAANIVQAATEGEVREESSKYEDKNPHAVALGRLGGLKGGKARAEKLTAEERKEIARKAAATRWGNRESGKNPKNK